LYNLTPHNYTICIINCIFIESIFLTEMGVNECKNN
jgi:hypothetical protein